MMNELALRMLRPLDHGRCYRNATPLTIGGYVLTPLPNRRSIRAKGYNYANAGFYFITICTHKRNHILATIKNGSPEPSAAGKIVLKYWDDLPRFFETISIDSSILMPNHFHGVLCFNEGNPYSLGQVIPNFKSVTTRRIHAVNSEIPNIWQRNYYERIVRTERELNMIRLYIDLNPLMWQKNQDLAEIEFKSEQDLSDLLEKYQR